MFDDLPAPLPVLASVPSIADRVRMISASELVSSDISTVCRAEAARIAASTSRWWLHVDLDALSTEALPAVDYPQPGGLDWNELEELTRAVLSVTGCGGMIVVIYNPDLDQDPAASRIARYVGFAADLGTTAR